MRNLLRLVIFHLVCSVVCLSQQPPSFVHRLHGIVKTPDNQRIGGLRLKFAPGQNYKNEWVVTNANGEFETNLRMGDYVVIIEPESLPRMKLYLKITEKGLNPDDLELVVDQSTICCSLNGTPFPKPISIPKPAYPPAARATRTTGETIVEVEIDNIGKVQAVTLISGHPLLAASAKAAAQAALFEPSQTAGVRRARLAYVFVDEDPVKPNIATYTDPFRVFIIAHSEIDISSYPK